MYSLVVQKFNQNLWVVFWFNYGNDFHLKKFLSSNKKRFKLKFCLCIPNNNLNYDSYLTFLNFLVTFCYIYKPSIIYTFLVVFNYKHYNVADYNSFNLYCLGFLGSTFSFWISKCFETLQKRDVLLGVEGNCDRSYNDQACAVAQWWNLWKIFAIFKITLHQRLGKTGLGSK